MPTLATTAPVSGLKRNRIESIDLLRGIVILIMALDHVRDYFHRNAYLFDPTDLTQTDAAQFFTRWITHFCAPVFVFLAGISAYLYGAKRSRRELSFFLFTRGLWLILAELFIITFAWTFNPFYTIYILQVIWAIGVSMICLAGLVYLNRQLILLIGILFIAAHNLFDNVHFTGNDLPSMFWSFLHEQRPFSVNSVSFFVGYPVLPWIGIIAVGYCFGSLYSPGYDPAKRKRALLYSGFGAIVLFVLLRSFNIYGDSSHWSVQKNALFSLMSFLNTSKYPPSLLYILMTLGPSLIFLAYSEGPLTALTRKIAVFGRVPMFFYVVHIYFVHLLAIIGAVATGHKWTDMILTGWVTTNAHLRGYGFSLIVVYLIWIGVLFALFPLCKLFDRYKSANQAKQKWLSYF